MIKYFAVPFAILIAAISVTAADTITFKNGDMITGEILKQTPDQVHFKSLAFGSVSISKSEIAKISPLPEEPASEPKKSEAPTAPKKPTTPPQTAEQKKGPTQWTGEAGLSIAMRESNTLRRSGDTVTEKHESFESYRLFGNIDWKSLSKRDNLRWDMTYRYSRSDVRKNDDYFNLTQNYKHTFEDNNYFASAKTMYQQDFRRRIENEFLQTAEMGVKWFNSQKFKLATSAGGGFHKYERLVYDSSSGKTEDLVVGQPKFIFDQSLSWQMANSLTLIQKYTHLGDLTDYHFVFSTGLENKLIRNLFLRVEYRLDRDTEVSYDDKGYYDKALLTSIRYKF